MTTFLGNSTISRQLTPLGGWESNRYTGRKLGLLELTTGIRPNPYKISANLESGCPEASTCSQSVKRIPLFIRGTMPKAIATSQ